MQRCGYCDCQSDIDHSEDEKEDHGSAQPAPPTKSRFHRLPPISTSRPLSRCHLPPAGVVLPGQIDGHTLLSAPIGSLFTRLRAVGPPRTSPAAGRHVNPADRTQERELGQFQSHPGDHETRNALRRPVWQFIAAEPPGNSPALATCLHIARPVAMAPVAPPSADSAPGLRLTPTSMTCSGVCLFLVVIVD